MRVNKSENYSFALNSNGFLVHASKSQHGEKYFCPICKTQMIPHLGKSSSLAFRT